MSYSVGFEEGSRWAGKSLQDGLVDWKSRYEAAQALFINSEKQLSEALETMHDLDDQCSSLAAAIECICDHLPAEELVLLLAAIPAGPNTGLARTHVALALDQKNLNDKETS